LALDLRWSASAKSHDSLLCSCRAGRAFENSLTQARNVTSVIYDRESGGAEHCQLGAITLWHAAFFEWLFQKFPQCA
jgi:hypothetical protein